VVDDTVVVVDDTVVVVDETDVVVDEVTVVVVVVGFRTYIVNVSISASSPRASIATSCMTNSAGVSSSSR